MRRLAVLGAAAAVAVATALPASAAPPGALLRVIVQLNSGAGSPTSMAQEVLGKYPGRPIAVYEHALEGFALELPASGISALANDPRVARISLDRVMTTAAETMPTGFDRVEGDLVPWGDVATTATHCPTGSDCADVDIAILDTGIELYHPDLNVYRATNCTNGLLFSSCTASGDLYDRNGHGTHVSGTAAACDNDIGARGVAACARLWSFKVLSDSGSGYLSWIIAGVDTVTANAGEIDVVNMSLTGEFSDPIFDFALSRSVAAGVVYVVAAGNSARDAATFSPAGHDDMITVSAIADYDGMGGGSGDDSCRPQDTDDVFALSFSNFGADVDIAAPGVCIYSTHLGTGYATYTGTSMASPHVAGAAALFIAKNGRDRNGDGNVDGTDVAMVRSALVGAGLPQGEPCGFTGDPDGYPEPMLFVNGSGFGGSGTCTMAGVPPPPVNNPPLAAADAYATDQDVGLVIGAPGVLANDTDADGDVLTAVLDSDVSSGTLNLNPDGSFAYTPEPGFSGTASFAYHASDGWAGSNTVIVIIDVAPIPPPTPPETLYLRTGVTAGVSTSGWTEVALDHTYTSMVVVATPGYTSSIVPVVVRVRNAAGNSFELSLSRTSGTAAVTATVYWMAVEEGVYTVAADGVKMEARKFTSTVTDQNNSWSGQARSYANSYTSPVVVGQVMSSNDSDWSVFWSRGSGRNRPPNGTLRVGKHVGEDPDTTRTNETIGYIVIEAGSGLIDETPYMAQVGNDSIRGVGNNPPYTYSIGGPEGATVAVASQTGMDGTEGGWAVLYGSDPVSASSLRLAIDEDRSADSERSHTTEQVAYIVFG